jgi:serine protease Do
MRKRIFHGIHFSEEFMKRVKIAIAAAFCVAVVAAITVMSMNADAGVFGNPGESPIAKSEEGKKAFEIQKVFRGIYDLYNDRIVYISTEQTVKVPQNPFMDDPFFDQFFGGQPNQGRAQRTQKRTGLGTGFIISEDGYICTNFHVVNGVDKVTVKVGNKSFKAEVVGGDERTDIALLKISSSEKFKPAYLGDSSSVKVGDWAIAIGNPFGLEKTFTVGVVSATGRKDVDMMGGSQSHIQTDASINPGNSGGPLINIRGEVIGINRMIYSQSGGSLGIGFAIPINTAKTILEQLKVNKKIKRGYIGVQISPLTEEYANELGLKSTEGALVGAIQEGSPAEKAGVHVGDVITSVVDKKVTNYGDLIDAIEGVAIGKTIRITVWRKGAQTNLFVTIKERP